MSESQAMVSRSLRLRKDTLDILHREAEKQGLGITVYIRKVLESLVVNLSAGEQKPVIIHPAAYGEDNIHYPEL